jgi:hypothetical protein
MTGLKMSKFERYFHMTVPALRVIGYLLTLYLFGILKGLILSFMIHKVYLYLIFKLFKLTPFSPGDLTFLWQPKEKENFNLLGALIFDKIDVEKMKNLLIERGIKNFGKMRSVHEYRFLDWWWKELPLEEVLNNSNYNPIEISEINIPLRNKDDLTEFCNQIIVTPIDPMKSLPYRLNIVINKNEESSFKHMLLIKFEHSFTDGIGLISLIGGLANDYSLEMFPWAKRQKKVTFLSQFMFIFLTFLQLPYLLTYPYYRNLVSLKSGETPFKSNKKFSGIPNSVVSDFYDFNHVTSINKQLNITFNDMMMSLFSASVKKYCRDHFKLIPHKIITMSPVAMRSFPMTIEEINSTITNNSSGVAVEMYMIDDPVKECKVIAKEYHVHVRNVYMNKFIKFLSDFMNTCLPVYLTKFLVGNSIKNFDVIFSNVPGPKNEIFYGDSKLLDMIPFSTPGYFNAFIGLITYAGRFRMMMVFDKNLEVDPKIILNYYDAELKSLINKFEKKIN